MSLFDFLPEEEPQPENEPTLRRKKRVRSQEKSEPPPQLEPAPPEPPKGKPPQTQPLSISDLTALIKSQLETSFSRIWVLGEISNFSRSRPGHIYLTLKDEGAQLSCSVWNSTASKIPFELKDGMEVICRGRLEVYPPHGKYQMIVTGIEPKGIGALELAFRQLHAKLEAEGLFRPERKRPIPAFVRTVAVITSPTGAAIRDFLQVLGRRTQLVNVRIIPAKVQGDGAAVEIANAIASVNRFALTDPEFADCIVITRGGGSTEDLWAFNEEPLVRAVAASRLPTISAVGHEIDISLCDLVADLRALTPSEAAERLAPEKTQTLQRLLQLQRRIEDSVLKKIQVAKERLRSVSRQSVFQRPERIIDDRRRGVDLLEQGLDRTMDRTVERKRNQLSKSEAALQALNPLSVLRRGYSLTQTVGGTVVRSAEELQSGDEIVTKFVDGTVKSQVR